MKMSRTLSYAVQALLELSELGDNQPVSCRQLAEMGGMPKRFLLQILRALVTKGILRSTRGVEGGYTLARPASQISLLEIVEAIDGPVSLELPGLTEGNAQLGAALTGVNSAVRESLGNVRLAQLAGGSRKGPTFRFPQRRVTRSDRHEAAIAPIRELELVGAGI